MPGCALCGKKQDVLKSLTIGNNSFALCDECFKEKEKEAEK